MSLSLSSIAFAPPGQAFTAQTGFARLGLVIVLLSAVASLTDYPLRTPALACLFALAVLWAAGIRSFPAATSLDWLEIGYLPFLICTKLRSEYRIFPVLPYCQEPL